MQKIKNNFPSILIIVLSLLIIWPLFLQGYFSHHDDLQVMRVYEMRKCLEDFQIPCRWVPDMGYGNGFPLFNFYGVLPYYIGALFSFITGYIWAAKIIFLIPAVFGGISMYFLGKELFGKNTGTVAGVLYLFAPYRALDLYVRGAVAESFALAIAPLMFYFSYKLIKENRFKNFLGFLLSLSAFLMCHNIMTMLFLPVLIVWMAYSLIINKFKNWLPLVLGVVLGFGLAAFFIIPAYLEQGLIQTETLTRNDLDFRVHFVTISQLFFNRAWGYGASILGPVDHLSFQIGWPYWWLVVIAGILLIFNLIRRKTKNVIIISFFLIIFLISVFMTHNRSAFVWEKIGILRFTQFPWRFLSLTIFSASLLGGSVVLFFRNEKWQKIIATIIIILTVLLNWNYFKPEKFYSNINDQIKLSDGEWETQQKASILDYLPKTALEPREKSPNKPIIISGKAQINNFTNKSNYWKFNINVLDQTKIELPVFDFPNWEVFIDNQKVGHNHNNFLGRISFDLLPGTYNIEGRLENTSIRNIANIISLLSILAILFLAKYGKTEASLFKKKNDEQ
ncbi:MAG: 6-pyruvoyl-tetrahydropterin synthase-related protein [Candidatus Staskawiczbacteria bacterium]|nr:6-pyruvoyl-tetrahydropterin synthase-related protein [Candidatus Staskawiczbacteria bacterium]